MIVANPGPRRGLGAQPQGRARGRAAQLCRRVADQRRLRRARPQDAVLHRVDQRLGAASRRSTSPVFRSIAPAEDPSTSRRLPDESFRPVRQGPRERRRRPHLCRPGRREPRRRRVASQVEHPARADPPRAVGGVHGRDARPTHRPPGRLHGHARPRRAESRHRRGLCAPGRDADDPDHRTEGDHERAPGALPDRRHRRDDEAADQVVAADRQRRQHSDGRARCFPAGLRGAAGPGSSGASRGHRRRAARPRRAAGAGAPDRDPGRARRRAGPRGGTADAGRAPARDVRRRLQPPAAGRPADRLRPPHRHPVLQHADGQGHGRRHRHERRRHRAVDGHGGADRARLRARGDRPRRPDPRDRPRHDREAAVHHGAEGTEGDPRRLHAGQRRAGVFPACRGRRRPRAEPGAAGRPHRRPAAERRRAREAARAHPRAHDGPRRGVALSADAAAHRQRRAQGDAGRRHRRARQRHVQDLVRALLPHAQRQCAAARQRAGDDGRRACRRP